MKSYTTILKLAVGAALLVAPMCAQTSAYIRVDVPFSFHIGQQALPAGEYVLKTDARSALMLVQSQETGQTTMTMTSPSPAAGGPAKNAQVKFRAYGNSRFLAGVWIPGTSNIAVAVSPNERELAKDSRPVEIAVAGLGR